MQSCDVVSKLAYDLKRSNNRCDLWDYAEREIKVCVENCIYGGSTDAAVLKRFDGQIMRICGTIDADSVLGRGR